MRLRDKLIGGNTLQITLLSVKNPRWHKYFLTMCPTYGFIDRADGRFNKSMGFMKDYAALVAAAWEVDQVCDRYLMNPEEETHDAFRALGLTETGADYVASKKRNIDNIIRSDETKGSFKNRFYDFFSDTVRG